MFSSASKAFQEVAPLRLLKSKLLQQSGLYLFGQILQNAVSLLLMPVWLFYLTRAEYGIINTLGAYANVLHILLMFGIYSAVTRHYFDFKNDHEEQRRYVTSNFAFLAVVPCIVLTVLIVFGRPLWMHMPSDKIPFHPLVVLMLITVYGGLLYRLPYSLYQAQQKPWKCVTLDLTGFFLSIGISLLLVVAWKEKVYAYMLGGCIAQTLVALIITGLLLKEWFVPRLEWRHISSSLAFGLPIVPHLLSSWVLGYVGLVMLANMVSLDDAGDYSLALKLGMGMLMIVTSINQAYQPYYFNLMTSSPNPRQKIQRILYFYIAGIGFVTLVGSLFAGELVHVITFYAPRYRESARYVPPMLLGYLLVGLYYFVSSPVFYHKKTHLLPFVTGASAILNIILSYLFIPKYGAIAAAWVTSICYLFMLVIYYVVAQRLDSFPYPLWRTMLTLAFLLAAIYLAGLVALFTPLAWLIKMAMVGVYLIFAYLLFIKPLRSTTNAIPQNPI
jgi:O-antigen/teichoic acid export membrane protein